MNKRPGQVMVTTEVAYCSFCARPRTLRNEERHLGTFVRTVVTCETCHRTLSSTMGVAAVGTPADEKAEEKAEEKAPEIEAASEPAKTAATPKRKPAPKAAAAKAKASTTRRTTKAQ
jgi:hypothetical protein